MVSETEILYMTIFILFLHDVLALLEKYKVGLFPFCNMNRFLRSL